MRNVKVLWFAICLLLGCVLILLVDKFVIPFHTSIADSEKPADAAKSRFNGPDATSPASGQETEINDGIIVQIGKQSITRWQLLKQLERKYGREMLNQMIDRAVIAQESQALGVTVKQQEVDAELKRMQQGYDSEEQFYNSMQKQLGLTKSQLQEDTYYNVLLEKIATRDVTISEQQVTDYIRTHPEEWNSHIQLHIRKITVASKEEAVKLRKEIGNGTDFGLLARKYSLDDAASDSGDLGWVQMDDPFVLPEVMNAAKKMKTGEISDPVKVNQGYAIVNLLERKDPDENQQKQIREYIRSQLAMENAEPMPDLLNRLREKYNVQIFDPNYK
ncbi:peptidylprolyl isomerase [Ferviditalea candida]|uniref:peptidylprolyl isomerase n=1 Tax=Ferviditalea candida TaxID=3108399 RepID=A0ABU5ZLZ0_9BACL|nr:peptidylprolyl isomerase [Paenibacillaceae bacterium T2]